MNTTAAIVQSSYIPWKGYFDLIRRSDRFILYDDVQFTRRDWRSRNRIKTKDGVQWLTIPVEVRGRFAQRIRDVRIAEPRWHEKHWKSLAAAYAKAPFFSAYREAIGEMYSHATSPWLSEINRLFIEGLCGCLGITTPLSWSSECETTGSAIARLVQLCRHVGATRYLSGPSARDYIEADLFAAAGITLEYIDYGGYREYPQVHPPFEHAVSAVDLIFNVGPAAPEYLLPLSRSG